MQFLSKYSRYVFIFLLVLGASLAVQFYLISAEQYQANSKVNVSFPVAVIDETGPTILEWHQYSKASDRFRGKLIANASNGVFNLADGRRFSLQAMKDGKVVLSLHDRASWFQAEYVIESEMARPLSLRQINPMMFGISFLLACVASLLGYVFFVKRGREE